ncbi:retron St85 family effector protein [Mixta calida]|uniref:retron St85 family effector protein n=1 Tax=Mixta calida TaxID=665913 RepID=UPI00290C77C7|nr:retron St85 family effector protein [Salmonella enterica subsp. enterica serovar Barranquilla]HBZ5647776.1 retron St85 family effector protein [Salmonella enterica subsp. enterica serovar Goldcoast]
MYDQIVKTVFSNLNFENFSVDNSSLNLIFVCGGLVDASEAIPSTMRGQLYDYTARKHESLHDSLKMAESFKDYIENGEYEDLLFFEHDLASISSLVIIFLESAGSLVELGIFSTEKNFYEKLCVIAPEEHVEKEDSFIYLGPLKRIKSEVDNSVLIYPFDSEKKKFEDATWKEICSDLDLKLQEKNKFDKFKATEFGHICMLILEIINISYPIQLTEIESTLQLLGISTHQKRLTQIIYLLITLDLILKKKRSSNTYYFPQKKLSKKTYVRLGSYNDKTPFDKTKNIIKLKSELLSKLQEKEERRIKLLKIYGEENE